MDKKGFTTIELIVSFVMVTIILATLIGFTITYRDRVKKEEIKSQLIDFKNTITKTVYDDIISLNYISMSNCVGQDNCVIMTDENGNSHVLKFENSCSDINLNDCGVYLVYNEIKYMLPDSNLNTFDSREVEINGTNVSVIEVLESASNLTSFDLKSGDGVYNLKMTFKHFRLDDDIEIMLTIN